MNETPKRRIESSIEIEALLESFRQKLGADIAILYKYIDAEDIEGTEILQLLSKAKDNFKVEDHTQTFSTFFEGSFQVGKDEGENIDLEKFITKYETGDLDLENENDRQSLKNLTESVKVLRYCTHTDADEKTSRWKFDYKDRPPKYLVFNSDKLNTTYHKKVIQGEGVTAAFCRLHEKIDSDRNEKIKDEGVTSGLNGTQKEDIDLDKVILKKESKKRKERNNLFIFATVDQIEQSDAHVKKGIDKNKYKNFGGHNAGWIILKKEIDEKKEKVIGCLRFEYYSKPKETIEEQFEKLATEGNIDLVVTIIKNVLEEQEKESYDKLYNCLTPILQKVIEKRTYIKKQKKRAPNTGWEQLESVHDLIEHLYYVFKRNTYHGETIIQRVNYFIEDLLETLELPKDIFGNVWENLRRHEDLLLYSIDNYRDHVMHQFHVFILGYLILYSDIEYFHKLIYKNYDKKIKTNPKPEPNIPILKKIDMIRIWALASLFHDCGYIFEKLPQGFKNFSNTVLGKELEPKFMWEKTILANDILATLSRISEYNVECEVNSLKTQDLFGILLQKAILMNDHGVVSAIILLKQESLYPSGYENVENIEIIVNIASIAIAMHNKPVFKEAEERSNQGICLSRNPIAFLLIYCDTVQEWGRKKSSFEKKNTWIIPRLEDIEFLKDAQGKWSFKVTLNYPANFKGNPPDIIELQKSIEPAMNNLVTEYDCSFEIDYIIRSSKVTRFNRKTFMCGKNICAYKKNLLPGEKKVEPKSDVQGTPTTGTSVKHPKKTSDAR